METVLGVGPAGGARRAFLAHLQSRMRRVVRKHDKPYAIFDPFGAWPNEDWWGGPASYMLDQIKNVIAPEVRESGCKFDFYCLELWRDIKGDIEHPNTKTYPKGFGRIRDELAKLGIGFALWNDVSGPLSWTCGENPKLWPDLTHDPTCPYQPELPWLCIAEEPLKGMFTGAFINHIRKNNLRLLKMDGNMSICYNPRHRHLPGVYSTEAIWNALADITRDLDRECPDLFIMLYWGCRSPWHLLYGDVSFDPGLALEAAHPARVRPLTSATASPSGSIRRSGSATTRRNWARIRSASGFRDGDGIAAWVRSDGRKVSSWTSPAAASWPSRGRTTAACRNSNAANWPTSSRC